MDRNKIINFVVIIICLLLVASIALNIRQYYQNRKLTAKIYGAFAEHETTNNQIYGKDSDLQENRDQSQPTGIGRISTSTGNADINELTYQLNAAEEELDYVWKQLSDAQTENNSTYDLQADRYLRDALDDEYDYLFRGLDLTPEGLERFKDILFNNRVALRDFYRKLYETTPSEEKRVELERLKKDINDEEERKIIESLGKGVYEKYKAYKNAFDEINDVRSFAASLGSDDKLTKAQEKALIEATQKELIYSGTDNEDAKILFPSEIYTENNIAEILSMHKGYNEAFIKAAQGILSPSQSVLLKGYLNKKHDNYENGLKRMIQRQERQSIANSSDDNFE
ncbi:MAG: hypothetical protein JW944_05905 [Deltaproteobacteria bacterium]|nr:hypothetical protein [Deltaproteobacteria bacterium]